MSAEESISVLLASRTGDVDRCNLTFWMEPTVGMRLSSPRVGEVFSEADDLFGAMSKIRLQLEKYGYQLLCNGARCDAYPSRMSRQSGGRKIYLLEKGRPAGINDIVDIFDDAEIGQVCSVAEQRSNFDGWINSLRKEKSAGMHEITEEVVEAAKTNPGGWVYKIEGQFGPDEVVPPHAIVGAWKVDSAGELTGEFVENPNYQPGGRPESPPFSRR